MFVTEEKLLRDYLHDCCVGDRNCVECGASFQNDFFNLLCQNSFRFRFLGLRGKWEAVGTSGHALRSELHANYKLFVVVVS